MPELPEVEGMRRRLKPLILGRRIESAEDVSGTATRSFTGVPFDVGVVGRRFTDTGRRAKNLLLTLDSGDTLVMHFMRNGMLEYAATGEVRAPHTWAVLSLDDGMDLRMRDTMRAGRWSLCPGTDLSAVNTLQGLGPEYTDPVFSVEYLAKRLSRKAPVKALLTDQSVVSGIGNAYAHEIAWEAGVRPDRQSASLNDGEAARLHAAISSVFERAIEARVSSPLNIMGDEGWEVARIHRRKGQKCPRCGAGIVSDKLGGGLIYYCAGCQK
ncbi:MAG TPA: DNA-formamidopyrimidine glycosylase family protein [Armatimonadota bacterium]|jgi:formamidopyrimidine-DNA glycosylase